MGYFPYSNRTVITHRPTLRYGSGFIAFPWSWVFLGCGVVLSQAAYGDPSRGLTPLINSARCSAEPWAPDWLAVGAASLEARSDWLRWLLHLRTLGQHGDPWKFPEHVVINELFLLCHSACSRTHTHSCTRMHNEGAHTPPVHSSWSSAACRLGFQI